MIRIVLENVALFLLPTIAYVAWVLVLGDTVDPETGRRRTVVEHLNNAPIFWLLAAGTAAVAIAMALFAAREETNIEKPYEPAIYKDGKIIHPGGK